MLKCEEYDRSLKLIKQYIGDTKKYGNILEKEYDEYQSEFELYFYMCKILYLQGRYDELDNHISVDILNKYDSYTDYLYSKYYKDPVEEDVVLPDIDYMVEKLQNGEVTINELNEFLGIDENEIREHKNRNNDKIIDYENSDFDEEMVIHYLMFEWDKSYNEIKTIRMTRMA